eukprot:scaffold434_cov358-Prasinococcus_capsulatus_cf.AAC.9
MLKQRPTPLQANMTNKASSRVSASATSADANSCMPYVSRTYNSDSGSKEPRNERFANGMADTSWSAHPEAALASLAPETAFSMLNKGIPRCPGSSALGARSRARRPRLAGWIQDKRA